MQYHMIYPRSSLLPSLHVNFNEENTAIKKVSRTIVIVFDDNVLYEDVTVNDLQRIIAPCYRRWDEIQFRYYTDLFAIPLQKNNNLF